MIDFVAARDGGLEFTTICNTRIFGATLEEVQKLSLVKDSPIL